MRISSRTANGRRSATATLEKLKLDSLIVVFTVFSSVKRCSAPRGAYVRVGHFPITNLINDMFTSTIPAIPGHKNDQE